MIKIVVVLVLALLVIRLAVAAFRPPRNAGTPPRRPSSSEDGRGPTA
jgi:hypothetical protein